MSLQFTTFAGDSRHKMWPAAQELRWEVFVVEQEVPFVAEMDARDLRPSTIHVVGSSKGHPGEVVATCRILPDGDWHFHLGRVAVAGPRRGEGLGRELVQAAADVISKRVPRGTTGTVVLDAQVYALGFYEACGYSVTDRPTFLDANIWHREMARAVEGTGPAGSLSDGSSTI